MKELFVAAAVLVALITAEAEPGGKALAISVALKGEWSGCRTVGESKTEGGEQVLTISSARNFAGLLNGTCQGTERHIIREDGSGVLRGSGLFSGEINGRRGTAVMTYSGTSDRDGHSVAHWVLDQGTDDLARVDGDGTFASKRSEGAVEGCTERKTQSAVAGTYAGTVRFLSR